jgi:hypothetical protein
MEVAMKPQQIVYMRVLASLDMSSGAQLASTLGKTRAAASYWRRRGFPKTLHSDLQILAGKLGKTLPPEFYKSTGIPAPSGYDAPSVDGACHG